jgi:hypothetical protein
MTEGQQNAGRIGSGAGKRSASVVFLEVLTSNSDAGLRRGLTLALRESLCLGRCFEVGLTFGEREKSGLMFKCVLALRPSFVLALAMMLESSREERHLQVLLRVESRNLIFDSR